MDIHNLTTHYQEIIDKESIKLSNLRKLIFRLGTLRLVVVFLFAFLVYIFCHNSLTTIILISLFVVVFASMLKYHHRLYRKKTYSEIRIQDAKNELKGLNYDFSAFDGATDKIDPEHSFSLDLDLFGERSLFQSINRTVTPLGKDSLASSLTEPLQKKEDVLSQQDAIRELTSKIDLASHFRTVGQLSDLDKFNVGDFKKHFSNIPSFYGNQFWAIMLYLVPACFVIFGIICLFDASFSSKFTALYILMLIFSSLPMKKIMKINKLVDKKTAVLETYSELFRIVEEEHFESELLKSKQQILKKNKASQSINQLKSNKNNLELCLTFPIIFIFNPFLLWNVHYAYRIEKWIKIHHEDVNQWFEVIAKFDSLVSLATFAYNHPDYTYPVPADSFVFEGIAMGHPLIHRNVCVHNDVSIARKSYFLVVTGANMAGKSTYLRTVGVNHTLACAGAPVCAQSLTFYLGKLVTNLRTADSLADNESYFFAELKRLKMIIDRLKAGEELFIILDEILKGTNSQDKQKGSLALMKQLINLDTNGIIATHDLVMGQLEQEYPQNVKNYCFEADIKEDQLSFTYKIREGLAHNMNACYLMKKMGITGL